MICKFTNCTFKQHDDISERCKRHCEFKGHDHCSFYDCKNENICGDFCETHCRFFGHEHCVYLYCGNHTLYFYCSEECENGDQIECSVLCGRIAHKGSNLCHHDCNIKGHGHCVDTECMIDSSPTEAEGWCEIHKDESKREYYKFRKAMNLLMYKLHHNYRRK